MKKTMMIIALALIASACAFGQIDRSKEVKPIVKELPAIEHFYLCPVGYDLKYFIKGALPQLVTYGSVNVSGPLVVTGDWYDTAPAQDILRTGEPVCVPKPAPIVYPPVTSGTTTVCCSDFVFTDSNGDFIRMNVKTGEIVLPKGCPVDKGAREFWEALKRYAKSVRGASDK
jgi:hypothetical protein